MKKFSLALFLILLFGLGGYAFVEFYWPRRSMPGQITSAMPPGAAPNAPVGTVPPAAPANAAAPSTTAAAPVTASAAPAEETSTDLALVDVGGHVDHVTNGFGPGRLGGLLNDGDAATLWTAAQPVTFPQDVVFSFFERQPALVAAVALVLPADLQLAPKEVEIWTAPPGAAETFTKVAAKELADEPTEQKISFPAVEAERVKLRVIAGHASDRVGLGEVRILEGRRSGYTALAERRPDVAAWKGSPRQAAQLGLDWLQQAAVDWDQSHKCFGCHNQAQVMMGQAIALRNGYVVDANAFALLEEATRKYQEPDGTWFSGSVSATQFAEMALAYADDRKQQAGEDAVLRKGLDYLIARQTTEGAVPVDRDDPPIVQGRFMTSANSAFVLMRAYEHTSDAKYKSAADRALAWIAASEPATTQDRVFSVLALSKFGTPDQKRLVRPVLERLAADQQEDGGWKEIPRLSGSNALATGEVLYALKQAGASISSDVFRRGVGYLLRTQIRGTHTDGDGRWRATNTESTRPSDFAPTMWASIGLAGAYSTARTGGLEVLFDASRTKPTSRNLEIVLDASGSMKLPLGKSTRWRTAQAVLAQLVQTLPADFNVGLRTYGHRFSARSPQTCSDTELVVPIARLDRQHILDVASRLQPRGETPLVRSVLFAPDDLRSMGGGSVILITDGEESCKGDLKDAAEKLRASGVDVSLNIVGFTLKGKTTEEQLGALANATGGTYYSAQDGDALARAVTLAALQALPYDVIDANGRLVATAETGRLGLELAPGSYRIVIRAPGQELDETVDVAVNRNTTIKVSLNGDRFGVER